MRKDIDSKIVDIYGTRVSIGNKVLVFLTKKDGHNPNVQQRLSISGDPSVFYYSDEVLGRVGYSEKLKDYCIEINELFKMIQLTKDLNFLVMLKDVKTIEEAVKEKSRRLLISLFI